MMFFLDLSDIFRDVCPNDKKILSQQRLVSKLRSKLGSTSMLNQSQTFIHMQQAFKPPILFKGLIGCTIHFPFK